MGFRYEGSAPLQAMLSAKIKAGMNVDEVVKRNAAEMQEKAQRYAPVDTGFLKRNINLSFGGGLTDYSGQVSGDANYDGYQEYGTRYQPGTPHIRPAYYDQRPIFLKDIKELVDRK